MQMNIEKIDKNMAINEADNFLIKWYSPMEQPFRLSGFAWISKDRVYRRLPVNPNYCITENVDWLADCTAGGQICFGTNTSKLVVKVTLSGVADMYHMPATGQCGFDCYLGEPESKLFYSSTNYNHREVAYECQLFNFGIQKMMNVTLNFPLYQGVKSVLIGLDYNAEIEKPPNYNLDKPIVFYGTSITQGGCASRPGMAYTNILSRRLNAECINLGFSGNGKGEPEMAKIISEIENPACLVLDYEANARMDGILEKTLPAFIGILRENHPLVPILIISRPKFSAENFYSESEVFENRMYLNNFQRTTVNGLRCKGDNNIYFFDSSDMLGDDFHECTVDGVHPTDLGFMRIADNLEPVLGRLIFNQ